MLKLDLAISKRPREVRIARVGQSGIIQRACKSVLLRSTDISLVQALLIQLQIIKIAALKRAPGKVNPECLVLQKRLTRDGWMVPGASSPFPLLLLLAQGRSRGAIGRADDRLRARCTASISLIRIHRQL